MQGNFCDAINQLQEVVRKFPLSPDARPELGSCFYQTHEYSAALQQYGALQTVNPDDLQAHYILSLVYKRMELDDKAKQAASRFADEQDDSLRDHSILDYLRSAPDASRESEPWHLHVLSIEIPHPDSAIGRGMGSGHDEDPIHRWHACEKWEYVKIIYAPDGYIDVSPRQDFYKAAHASVQRLIHAADDIEGTAALFLFRHYMELTLKGLVLSARHLKTEEENMPAELVLPPTQGHDLKVLWEEVTRQVSKKLGAGVWPQWDHKFVEQCIEEFHVLDPSSERLRYIREKKHLERDPANLVSVAGPVCGAVGLAG